MDSQDELQRIFEKAAALKVRDLRDQLAHRNMLALADHFEGWALDRQVTQEQAARLMGHAENMRQLAELVGPQWNPPPLDQLSLLGFLGRTLLGKE
jgi:hypothetical protein